MADRNNTETDIILDIKVRYEDAIDKIQDYRGVINRTKEDQKLLREELRKGYITRKEYNKSIIESNAVVKQSQSAIRLLEKEIQNNIKVENELAGSYNALSAQMSILKNQYKELSKEQRESDIGIQLSNQIKELNNELREADGMVGVFSRDVGSYKDAILEAASANNTFAKSLLEATTNGKGLSGIIDLLKTKSIALFQAIIANPVIAVLAVVVAGVIAIKKAIDSSEESTAKWNQILAPTRKVLDTLANIFQKFVGFLLDGIIAMQNLSLAAAKFLEKIPFVGKYIKEANNAIEESIELEKSKLNIDKLEREAMVQNAKNAKDIAELRAKAEEKQNYTAQQRLDFVKQANKIEEQNAVIAKNIAKERLRIAQDEASRTENTKEKEQEIANLMAEVYQTETNLFNKRRELLRKENAIIKETTNEAKKNQEDGIKKAKEYSDRMKEIRTKELESIREYEDSLTALMDEGIEKQRRVTELNFNRQIEDLKNRLKTEKNLSVAARENINNTILNLEKQKNVELDKLSDENIKRETDIQLKNIQLRIAASKKESNETLALRIQALQIQRDVEIKEAEKTGIDISLIRAKYQKQIDDETVTAQKLANDKLIKEEKLYWQNRILQVKLDGEQTINLQIEQKQKEIAEIKRLEGESDAEYLNRQLSLDLELKTLNEQKVQNEIETQQQILSAYETLFGALSGFLQEFADDSSALASFAKALAVFEIGLNTAKALSAGIAAAQSVPFPGNLIAIATTTATILANIAKAKQVLSSTKEAKSPQFAQGGLVSGSGSGTSDSISAKLSNGESVLNARATAMFSPVLSAFNQIGGGVPISTQDVSSQVMGEEVLSRAFAKAVGSLPNPVVSVQEINNVENRVELLEITSDL